MTKFGAICLSADFSGTSEGWGVPLWNRHRYCVQHHPRRLLGEKNGGEEGLGPRERNAMLPAYPEALDHSRSDSGCWTMRFLSYFWAVKEVSTVDGRNPAPVDR